MLKSTLTTLNTLSGCFTKKLAEAIRNIDTDKEDALYTKALTSNGGTVLSWAELVGQSLTIKGFDLVESEIRVYSDEREKEFKRLKDSGTEVLETEDGRSYVTRTIAYVAAICDGARSNVSVTTLRSFATNGRLLKDDPEVKRQKVLNLQARDAADFLAKYADTLMNKTLYIVATKKGKVSPNSLFDATAVAFCPAEDYVAAPAETPTETPAEKSAKAKKS